MGLKLIVYKANAHVSFVTHMKPRKRGKEFLGFLRYVRRRYGGEKLYLVLDNYSTHKMKDVLEYARQNNIELVFTPTNASWLNRIEGEFTAVREVRPRGTPTTNRRRSKQAPSRDTSYGETNT